MKTTQDIENYLPTLNKLLGFSKNEPKWITLRFIINISLSFNQKIDIDTKINFDGKQYNLAQITGFGKENDDYTDIYWSMIEAFENINIQNKKQFEEYLEYHLLRGYKILKSSLNGNSNLYEFLLQEFYFQDNKSEKLINYLCG